MRAQLREHPVHDDPRRADIERWGGRHDELARTTRQLERDVDRQTGSLARELRRIVSVLEGLGYLVGPQGRPEPSDDGRRLAAIYVDTDLLLAECIRDGVRDDLAGPAPPGAAGRG